MNTRPVTTTIRICAQCRTPFKRPVWERPHQQCCSRSCARKHSPQMRAHLRRIGIAGGKAGGAARRAKAAQAWAAAAEGMTKGQIAAAFYRRGYRNAYQVGMSAGYEKGYDAAMKELRVRRTA